MTNKKLALIVEESKTIQLYFKNLITPLGYEVITATTFDDVEMLLAQDENIDFTLVSMDINEDAESIVDFIIKKNIAVILLSGSEDYALKSKLIKKDIIDYVEKTSSSTPHEVVKLINRLNVNVKETILVVDDSTIFRKLIKNLLQRHRFNVIEAEDGEKGLEEVKGNKNIKLIITDYEMPNLDGLGLIKGVRKLYSTQSLPIIVVSSLDSQSTIVKCMKNGANDYLHKPFSHGEFFGRVYLTLAYKENLDLLAEQKEAYEALSRSLEVRVLQEIKKNKQQASHMLQQSRLAQMGEMISMIAHQWRQPLASISAISGTLSLDIMMDEYKADFFQERLESINELAQHLSSTIDDFRGFFRENKKAQQVVIKDIVEGTLNIIGPTLETKNIKVELDFAENITVTTYVNEVKQVILNILKNAEDVLVEKKVTNPAVWIKGHKKDGCAEISIEDNAGGIEDNVMAKIFDPYFSTKKDKDGTGLGLYMSKTIIEEHCKGKLTVQNSQNGAKFIISFPLKEQVVC